MSFACTIHVACMYSTCHLHVKYMLCNCVMSCLRITLGLKYMSCDSSAHCLDILCHDPHTNYSYGYKYMYIHVQNMYIHVQCTCLCPLSHPLHNMLCWDQHVYNSRNNGTGTCTCTHIQTCMYTCSTPYNKWDGEHHRSV